MRDDLDAEIGEPERVPVGRGDWRDTFWNVRRLIARLAQTRYRADVVAELPASAPPGYLLLTPGDPNLYVGTGAANPLRKIPTQPV